MRWTAALLVAALLVGLAIHHSRQPDQRVSAARSETSTTRDGPSPGPASELRLLEHGGHTPQGDEAPSVAQIMRLHWGSDYDEIAAQAEANGVDLEASAGDFAPWKEVADALAPRVLRSDAVVDQLVAKVDAWPDQATRDGLRSFCGDFADSLADAELRVIDSMARPFSEEISSLARLKQEHLRVALRTTWDSGRFRKAPFFLPEHSSAPGSSILSKVLVGHGWAVGIELTHEDWPQVAEWTAAIHAKQQERSQAIQDYLDSLH